MKEALARVVAGEHLNRAASRAVFERIMAGEAEPAWLGGFLSALSAKGETVEEIVGAAEAMRAACTHVRCASPCVDTCGTGGDGISTFNVSTTAAIVAAAAGAIVAKHGNRTNTRVSGSAEVLAELGVNIEADVPTLERCLAEVGIAFLYARNLHPAMKYAAPVRMALGVRTIFNLLGPLCNPASATRQILGVSRIDHVDLLAHALRELGAARAWVVHGADGLCDLTVTGPTQVAELRDGAVARYEVTPAVAGLSQAPLQALLVKTPAESAVAVKAVLAGEHGARRDHTLMTAGAALVVSGMADCLRSAVETAAKAIDSGAANAKLADLIKASQGK